MSVFSSIKNWFKKTFSGGGGGSSSRSSSSSRSRSSSTERASRVSNYGGGGSRSYRENYSTGSARYQSREDEERRRRQEQKEKRQATTNALASISKRTDALASGKNSSPASTATTTGSGTTRVLAKIGEKATPPDPKEQARQRVQKDATKKLKQISDDRKEFNKATGDKYNVDKNGTKARIAQKSQAYDVKAEKYETEKHPIATSLGRGAVSGVTFGGSEILARTSKNRRESGAEAHYQQNKNAKAEMAGEIAGSLVGFGLTEAGATKLASKVAPKALKSGGANVAKSLAKNSAFRTAAKKEAERTGIKVTEEVIDRFARQRAQRLVNSIGQDMAVNLTTGAAMDVNQSLRDSMDENGNIDWKKFRSEMGTNAALNLGLGGAVTVAPALRTSRGIIRRGAREDALNLARRINAEEGLENLGRRTAKGRATNALATPRIGESIDDTIARRAGQSAEMNAVDRQMPQMRQAMQNAFAQNADEARRVDMNEILAQNSPFRPRPVEEAVRPQPVAEAVRPQIDEAAQQATRRADQAYQYPDTATLIRELDERGEQWLGQHGHITANDDGTYNLFRNGVGDSTLSREEAVDYISRARESLQGEELARAERERVTRTTPLNEAETARIAEIDNEAERLRAESNADAEALRNNRYNGIDEYDARQAERAKTERSLSNERDNIVRKEPPQTRATEQAPIINEGNVPRTEASEARVTPPETRANTAEPKAELPRTEEPQAEVRKPRTKEEAIQMARESQTREESEKLLRDYFDENDEVDLGIYGQVSKNADGTYTISIDGAGEKTLTKAEVEKRITESTKRAYAEPDVIDDVKDVVYKRRERISFRDKLKKAASSARRMISDSLASFEDAERALAKAEHRQVDYGAINEVRAHQAKANRSISNAQLDYNGNKYSGTVKRIGADGVEYEIENGKSLVEIYKGMDEKTEEAFDAYLNLRHAPDRLLQGKPVFDNKILKDIGNLNDPKVCTAEADKLLAEHPEFAKKAEEVYQYTQNELKNRVDAGLLTQKTVDEWNEMYPHYVPTGRAGFNEIHGVNGPIVGATEIKAAKGSGRDINSIRDQLEAATTRNWRDISTNEMFKKYFGDRVAADLAKDADGGIGRVLDNTINLGKKETGNSSKYYADVYIDGKKHTVELEERFYESLEDLYKNGRLGGVFEPIDTVNDSFSKVASVWKNLITEWSPIFMVKNGMRDFPEAIINSRQSKEFISVMPDAMRDLMNGGPFSEALKDAGISQSTFIDIDKALKAGKDKKSLLSRANEAVEMYPRLCEYMATLKKAGYDLNTVRIEDIPRDIRARAAANAADVTVNFGRSGSVGKMLNKGLVPFFNPSVQGWSKFVRNVTERDLTTKEGIIDTLSFFAKASALGAGANTVNNFLYKDNPNYQQISARDKANNYIIAIGDADTTDLFVKIPKSRFASAYGIPSVNLFNENKMGWAEAIKVANDQVAPIDPIESTLFRPVIDASNNRTWYGTSIVPESIENKTHPSEEYDENTSLLGRALGKATENMPKELQISPKKADYLIDAETGIAGDFLLPALTPSRQGGGKGVGKYLAPMGNVVKRQFTIDSATQNDLSSRFYDKMQTAEDNKKSSKATDKDSAEYKRMNAYQKEVSTLTTAIRDLQAGDRATKQEDIRGLQEVRNKMMQDALDGKKPPSSAKAMDAVQKYVGTSYAIDKFGSSADKEAMKVYGASVYGNISEKEMQKKIDADTDFYKGVRAVGKMEDQLAKATGSKATSNLSKAVALASVGASDELFGAYEGTKKSRTETAIKMDRARNYISDGGSTKEFVKLEKARKTLGKLSDYDKEAELDNALAELKSGKINEAEYYQKQGEIKYNANISYVGLATSLAESNAPSRGYVLYDIKAKNVQKGINLAAMGFTARDYREMAKAVDADGNGYPKKQEIIDYVNSRNDIEDKATLYDALYYYKSSYNPFGTPTNYTREQAAENGKARGVEQISNEKGALKLKDDEESGKSGYRRYGRRRWRRWRRWGRGGHSSKAKVPTPKTIKASSFKQGEALVSKRSSSGTKVQAPKLERVKAKIDLPEAKW